jgi:hypothetical protein
MNLLSKNNIPKLFSAIKKISEKYYFSERVSSLPREESRVCCKIVGASEKF